MLDKTYIDHHAVKSNAHEYVPMSNYSPRIHHKTQQSSQELDTLLEIDTVDVSP